MLTSFPPDFLGIRREGNDIVAFRLSVREANRWAPYHAFCTPTAEFHDPGAP